MERVPGLVEKRLVVGEAALGARDQVDDVGRIRGDHAGARILLRAIFEIEPDVRDRLQLEAQRANGLDADLDGTILRICRLERRQASQPAEVRARGKRGALGPEQPLEPAVTQTRVFVGRVVCRPAQHALELPQRDLLLGLVACDSVAFAGELALEVVTRDEQLPAAVVETRVELPRQGAELLALRVVGQHGEDRLGRVERKLVAVEGEPCREQRVLELVLSLGELGIDDARLAGAAEPESRSRSSSGGVLLGFPQHFKLPASEEIGVPRDDRSLLRRLLLADANRAELLSRLRVVRL